jgi:uncharacterized protein YcbX
MNPYLACIRLYPVKSLDPLEVDEVVVLRDAGLAHDREFCLLDENGVIVNSKRFGEQLIPIRSEVDLGLGELTLHTKYAADSVPILRSTEYRHSGKISSTGLRAKRQIFASGVSPCRA